MLCRAMICPTDELPHRRRAECAHVPVASPLITATSAYASRGMTDPCTVVKIRIGRRGTAPPATCLCTIRRPFFGLPKNNLQSLSRHAKQKSSPPPKRLKRPFTYERFSKISDFLRLTPRLSLSTTNQQSTWPTIQKSTALKTH
eukprot:6184003-Pleurochrysis_carterae.AAC.1